MSVDLEAVERGELESIHAAAPATVRGALGLHCERIGSALVSIGAQLPETAIVVNRAIGLGVTSAADIETVEAILLRYRAAGVTRYFVHLHPDSAPPGLAGWLVARGLERARSWVKFTRGREPPPTVGTSVEVRHAREQDMGAFARIATAAFDLGGSAEAWLGRLNRASGFRAYVGWLDDRIVATGGLYIHDDVGWLDFGATSPDARNRGAQSALLRQRILDALDLGCRVVATATGEAVPGDPQHSYRNILKMGFHEAYVRENYAPQRSWVPGP
jgi:GNAT superfamily N-acetyltransferase